MLALPLAESYFPDLTVQSGRVHRRTAGGPRALESETSTAGLMSYFNPNSDRVDDAEAERAARMVDWCVRDPALRDLNVDFAVRQQRRKLAHHATKVPLDGLVDKLCLVVLDILHQGRAGYASIRTALASGDPFDSLLGLGGSQYGERIATLRAGIRDLSSEVRSVARCTTARRTPSSCPWRRLRRTRRRRSGLDVPVCDLAGGRRRILGAGGRRHAVTSDEERDDRVRRVPRLSWRPWHGRR